MTSEPRSCSESHCLITSPPRTLFWPELIGIAPPRLAASSTLNLLPKRHPVRAEVNGVVVRHAIDQQMGRPLLGPATRNARSFVGDK
jgi:hypothetical protein